MKKLLFTLAFATAVFAGNLHAQTATTDGGLTKEQKQEKLKSMTPEERRAVAMKTTGNRAATKAKLDGDASKKAKVRAHKDQIVAKAGSKEAAKEHLQQKHQAQKDETQKDKVKAHKDEIVGKTGSKQEAKAKLQRKHDKNNE